MDERTFEVAAREMMRQVPAPMSFRERVDLARDAREICEELGITVAEMARVGFREVLARCQGDVAARMALKKEINRAKAADVADGFVRLHTQSTPPQSPKLTVVPEL